MININLIYRIHIPPLLFLLVGMTNFSHLSSQGRSSERTVLLVQLLDAGNFQVLYKENQEQRFYPGSLLKPFAAWYLLTQVKGFSPEQKIICRGWGGKIPGVKKACWIKNGHGPMNLWDALAHSCNFYFYTHLQSVSTPDYFQSISREWGFPSDLQSDFPDAKIGDRMKHKITALQILTPYLKYYQHLQSHHLRDSQQLIMSLQGKNGTIAGLQKEWNKPSSPKLLLAKTGTSQDVRGTMNGTVIVFFRLQNSEKVYALLLHQPGNTGTTLITEQVPELVKSLFGKKDTNE